MCDRLLANPVTEDYEIASVANGGTITFANSVETVSLADGLTFDSGRTATIDGGGDVTVVTAGESVNLCPGEVL